MTSAVPVRNDLAQGAMTGRSQRSWATGTPAIVLFDRGRRLGALAAAAAGRQRAVAGEAASGASALPAIVSAVQGERSSREDDGVASLAPGGSCQPTASRVPTGAMASRRRRVLVTAGAFGAVGMLIVPLPAGAAPITCEQAERYSAQSGSQILRLNALGTGDAQETPEVHVGDAKSAMVAQAPVSSAAVARMIDAAGEGDPGELSEGLQQQAPPTNKKPHRRTTAAGEVGPFSLGGGTLSTHAQWQAGMACGAAGGEVTRATARLSEAGIVAEGGAALVRVPGKVESESTTRLERRGETVATVASAGLDSGGFELLGGAVKIKILKAPSLRASMSIQDGGEVRYLPASVQVSGDGFKTARLDTAGDDVEITLEQKSVAGTESGAAKKVGPDATAPNGATKSPDAGATEPDAAGHSGATGVPGAGGVPGAAGHGGAAGRPDAAGHGGALSGVPSAAGKVGTAAGGGAVERPGLLGALGVKRVLGGGDGASLPGVPGLPEISEPETEAAPVVEPGTKVRIALGDVRQATRGRAIAARAAALSVTVTQSAPGPRAAGYASSVLDFDMGVLEAAAVAPETAGGVSPADTAGAGGGLPITGPRVDLIALSGVALLIAGTGALIFGMRGRSRS